MSIGFLRGAGEDRHDALGRVAVPQGGTGRRVDGLLQDPGRFLDDSVRRRTDDSVRAVGHGDRSLGVLTQREARNAEGRRLFPGLTVADNLKMGAFLPSARKHFAESLERVFATFLRH